MTYSRLLSVFWGLVCLFFAFFAGSIEGTVIEVINKISSVFFGPILAVFLLAILTKKTNAMGANVGIIAGVAFNIILWLYVPQIFWFWWNALGCLVTIVVAMLVSALIRQAQQHEMEIVVYKEGKREVFVLASFFVVIVIVAVLMPSILG